MRKQPNGISIAAKFRNSAGPMKDKRKEMSELEVIQEQIDDQIDSLEEALKLNYEIVIEEIEESDDSYYMAYFEEIGQVGCSGCGETKEEALEELELVKQDVFQFYIEAGRTFPKPKAFK